MWFSPFLIARQRVTLHVLNSGLCFRQLNLLHLVLTTLACSFVEVLFIYTLFVSYRVFSLTGVSRKVWKRDH